MSGMFRTVICKRVADSTKSSYQIRVGQTDDINLLTIRDFAAPFIPRYLSFSNLWVH